MTSDTIDRLEAAREALNESGSRALRLLPPASALPRALRPERDLVEADARRAQGFFGRAERLYARVLRRVRAGDDAPLFVEACLGSAAGLRSVGRTAPARRRLLDAGRAAGKAGLAGPFRERLRLEEALVLRAEGRFAEALRRLRPMLGAALRREDYSAASFLLWAIGGAERFRGRLEASEYAFCESDTLARRAGDLVARGYALFGLGGVSRIRGDLASSVRYYKEAGRIFAATDDVFAKAYAECGLANALRRLGRLEEAERRYRAAHKLYSSLEDPVDLAYVDWGLGQVRLVRGDCRGAEPHLRRALRAFEAGAEDRGVVLARASLAHALHARGRTREAERLFESALRLARAKGIHTHLEVFT